MPTYIGIKLGLGPHKYGATLELIDGVHDGRDESASYGEVTPVWKSNEARISLSIKGVLVHVRLLSYPSSSMTAPASSRNASASAEESWRIWFSLTSSRR